MRSSQDNFTRKQREQLRIRAGGNCELCHAVLKIGEGEAHHIKEANDGGKPIIENGLFICRPCHRPLTAAYVKELRKHERIRDRHNGTKLPSRTPMAFGRNSPLKRKMNGDIVQRNPR